MAIQHFIKENEDDLDDATKAYIAACNFEGGSKALHDAAKVQPFIYSVPWMVNLALTVEVYLKCLLLNEGKQYTYTHDLMVHFNHLTEESKKSIERHYLILIREWNAKKPKDNEFDRLFSDIQYENLSWMIQNIKAAFVEWRYYFQRRPTHPFVGAGQITIAIKKRILELKPEYRDINKKLADRLTRKELK